MESGAIVGVWCLVPDATTRDFHSVLGSAHENSPSSTMHKSHTNINFASCCHTAQYARTFPIEK